MIEVRKNLIIKMKQQGTELENEIIKSINTIVQDSSKIKNKKKKEAMLQSNKKEKILGNNKIFIK